MTDRHIFTYPPNPPRRPEMSTTETTTDPVTERVAVAIAREHLIGAADWNHLLPSVRVLYRECARAALAAAGVEQLRAELAAFVEASLEPCDYTVDHECPSYEPTDYAHAKANIAEMHRVLNVREGRLFDAMDERKRLDAEVARLTAENAELRRDIGLAEDAHLEAEIRAEKAGA